MITLMCAIILNESVETAAVGALGRLAKDVEYSGAILQEQNGSVCVTEVARAKDDKHFEFRLRLEVGEKLVAVFHTHVARGRSDQFSDDDIQMARKLKVISYIRDNQDGRVKRWENEKVGEVVG